MAEGKWKHITGRLAGFLKTETVLCVAVGLAVITMFFVPLSADYMGYINWRVLSLLLCLMYVMQGFKEMGVFSYVADRLIAKTKSFGQIEFLLVMLCFFFSMLVTNDVALITFVPFAIEVLKEAKREDRLILVIVLQTMAANLGSMLTPIGNPQNLYLYALSGFRLSSFLEITAPVTVISFLLLFLTILISGMGKADKDSRRAAPETDSKRTFLPQTGKTRFIMKLLLYCFLFLISLATVAEMVPYQLALAITVLFLCITERGVMKRVDYCLLLTFIAFFVFIGNMGALRGVAGLLERYISGHEFIASLLLSQIISNVPAALLLSGFTTQIELLILGTNIGGLGTLIASMASLISYKQLAHEYPQKRGRYLAVFTFVSIVYLAILVVFARIYYPV